MRNSRGLVVILPDGGVRRYEDHIDVMGEGAPSIIDINGARYLMYRYTLFGIAGRQYGFIASLEHPSKAELDRAAVELFGSNVFGLLRLQRIA